MKYKILEEKTVFDGFFKIKKATVTYDTFDQKEITADRLCLDRGNSVAILIYEKDTDCFLFTKQFRYPTISEPDAWLLEITAGSLPHGDDPEQKVREEVEEEIGYEIETVEFINASYVSPGGTSEKSFLYYAEVNSTDKTSEGGGLKSEQEDIQLVKLSKERVIQMYHNKEFQDTKTIMAIQWYLLRN
ncbi:NUDIX domain-containing protein [uncultured Kordia sp.]|uniref:NUDIX domain-containing protein n=1 Tax=uncultured Kordia sp. TaxID=507699 RepID=UPI0026110D40|nr:NUDIX domain-containing protein [uncultured Kordia sp.]